VRERLRGVARWIAWLGGVFFAAVAATVLVLTMTGSVTGHRWAGAVEVLRGTAVAVETAELARLRAAEKQSENLSDAKQYGEARLLESWLALSAEKDRFGQRKKAESDALEVLANKAKTKLDDIKTARNDWVKEQEEKKQEHIREQEKLKRAASDKVKRVYRYMEPAAVAVDLESRLASGKEDEVAELVREMSDRSAAEVLEAFRDPASRMKVYEALAGGR